LSLSLGILANVTLFSLPFLYSIRAIFGDRLLIGLSTAAPANRVGVWEPPAGIVPIIMLVP
jgi:hypothetical protein